MELITKRHLQKDKKKKRENSLYYIISTNWSYRQMRLHPQKSACSQLRVQTVAATLRPEEHAGAHTSSSLQTWHPASSCKGHGSWISSTAHVWEKSTSCSRRWAGWFYAPYLHRALAHCVMKMGKALSPLLAHKNKMTAPALRGKQPQTKPRKLTMNFSGEGFFFVVLFCS